MANYRRSVVVFLLAQHNAPTALGDVFRRHFPRVGRHSLAAVTMNERYTCGSLDAARQSTLKIQT